MPVTTEEAPRFLRYADCQELLGAFPASSDAVTLPEGFAPAPLLGAGPAALFVASWSCGAARNASLASEEAFVETFVGFSVEAPEALRAANGTFHAILLGVTTGSPMSAATYASWGIPVDEGVSTFSWEATPAGGVGSAAGTAGPVAVDMRVSAVGSPSPEEEGLVRFYVVEDGVLVSGFDIAYVPGVGRQGQATTLAPLPGAPAGTTGLGFWYAHSEDRYLMTPLELPRASA